jgi:hypothetical protein
VIESLTSYWSRDETAWKAIWPFHPQTVGHGMRCDETAWQIHNKASVTHKLVVGCDVMRLPDTKTGHCHSPTVHEM